MHIQLGQEGSTKHISFVLSSNDRFTTHTCHILKIPGRQELPVITTSGSMTAIWKRFREHPTHLRRSDMDLSFPIPVIGKVAISTLTDRPVNCGNINAGHFLIAVTK
jgi:hypothetical protein